MNDNSTSELNNAPNDSGLHTIAVERLQFQSQDIVADLDYILLKAGTQGASLVVTLPAPQKLMARDTIQLTVNKQAVGNAFVIKHDYSPGELIELPLEHSAHASSGVFGINYLITLATINMDIKGPEDQKFTVDYEAPDLRGIHLDLNAATLLSDFTADNGGAYITRTSGLHEDYSSGDRLEAKINGQPVATGTVVNSRMSFRLLARTLMPFNSSSATSTIRVTDIAGNVGESAPESTDLHLDMYQEGFSKAGAWSVAPNTPKQLNLLKVSMDTTSKDDRLSAQEVPAGTSTTGWALRVGSKKSTVMRSLVIETSFFWRSASFELFSELGSAVVRVQIGALIDGNALASSSSEAPGLNPNIVSISAPAKCNKLTIVSLPSYPPKSQEFWLRSLRFSGVDLDR